MSDNGALNVTSAAGPASESNDEKTPASAGSLDPITTRPRAASLPAVVSGAIPCAGPVLGLRRRTLSLGSRGQFVGASAARLDSFGGFGRGSCGGLAGGSSGGSSATVQGEESDSDDSVDSGDLRFAGIVNENDSDVEDWDSDNHISKKQRRQ